jgi:hypothetical protein
VEFSSIAIGAFRIARMPGIEHVDGETCEQVQSSGRGALYEVGDGGGMRLSVRYTRWDNRERDVVATVRHDSPQAFDTLIERLRLPITRRGTDHYAELRHVRLKPNGRGNLFTPSVEELDAGAGVCVEDELLRHGAIRVGTREQLLADTGGTRGRLGVLFPPENEIVPVIAFVCTRVAPVARGICA